MSVSALVDTLRARGVILEPRGDKLRVTPASAVTPAEVEALRAHKAEVLRLLTGSPRPAPPRFAWSPWPEALPGLGPRRVIPFTACVLCPRWTFASYGPAALCLDCATASTTPARIAYREALRRVWTLAAEGDRADPAACVAALDELARRLDDVGQPAATELRRRWEQEWWTKTGRCPRCGECGPYHDSARGGAVP